MSEVENIRTTRDESAWEIEIQGEISAASLAKHRDDALKELQKTATMDGFRPGHAPLERIVAVYGEQTIMRRAAEYAIQHELPELLAKEKVLIIEAPRVQTETPIQGKPLAFTARASLPPQVTLPDWKAIAHKHNAKSEAVTISDEEKKAASIHLRRERARIEKIEAGEEPQLALESAKSMEENALPELDDAFAQSIGYESAEKFHEAFHANIKNEKELQAQQLLRNAILDDLVVESTVRYPATLKEYELDDMEGRIRDDLSRMAAQGGIAPNGDAFEGYLKHVGKTREQLRKEWAEPADKRAKIRLILSEIARQEKIVADEAAVEKEVERAKEHYKDLNIENARAGIAHAMRNEKVLELLESQ